MAGILYTKDHAWVAAEGDRARVGISDFAQGELGEVAFVELPQVGRVVEQGEAVCSVDSLKSASEIYAPVSGTVVEVNSLLEKEGRAAAINRDPLGQGWLFVLRMGEPGELQGLLDAEQYRLFLQQG
jgi:glycine cleavage system H protein